MKTYDFVFVYEVGVREAEGIVLLSHILSEKGYSVAYINTWYCLNKACVERCNAKVAVIFAAYNTAVIDFALQNIEYCEHVINMQWEQLLRNIWKKDKRSYCYLRGKAKMIHHISWGEDNYDWLVDVCGIPTNQVHKVGHIGMDFLRPEFEDFYLTREELFERFDLDSSKKAVLFISSFSGVNIPKSLEKEYGDEYLQITYDSYHKVIDWIEKYLNCHEDYILIYRPHPAESGSEILNEMVKKYSNFSVISEYSVKQWIKSSDIILNWCSTSIAEVFFSGKGNLLLRPIDIPYDHDIEIFDYCDKIKTYEVFEKSLLSDEPISCIDDAVIKKFYYFDENEPTYIRIIDVFEKIYNSKDVLLPAFFQHYDRDIKKGIREFVTNIPGYRYVIEILSKVNSNVDVSKKYYDYVQKMTLQNHYSKEKIKEIRNRIRKCKIC